MHWEDGGSEIDWECRPSLEPIWESDSGSSEETEDIGTQLN